MKSKKKEVSNVKLVGKGRNKALRWKKGHSSDSNPATTKFRATARSVFFKPMEGTNDSALTMENLQNHEKETSNLLASSATQSKTMSEDGATFKTWASNFTNCTNATFQTVQSRCWDKNSALHKEILAILAAVTEVIQSSGGKESETEYFAALLTTLATVQDRQHVHATLYLLHLAIKRTPESVLRCKFSEVAKLLMEILSRFSTEENASLLSAVLKCLATILRKQEMALWASSSTVQVYRCILSFVANRKPLLRRTAQQCVRSILKGSCFMLDVSPPKVHPAAQATADVCLKSLEGTSGQLESEETLYTLGLLQHVMCCLPQRALKQTTEKILRLMTLNQMIVTEVCMKTLIGLFSSEPKSLSLSAELNAQIITALYDFQPSLSDLNRQRWWLKLMQKAHASLSDLDVGLACGHLPKLFSVFMKSMSSVQQQVINIASFSFLDLLECSFVPLRDALLKTVKMPSGTLHQVLAMLEGGLGYQYHHGWSQILALIARMIQILASGLEPLIGKCLMTMAGLREDDDFLYKLELDRTVGTAITVFGPKAVLDVIPLQLVNSRLELNLRRSWLIPVLRDHITGTSLSYFVTQFVPLMNQLTKLLEKEPEKVAQVKTVNLLLSQIWSLLPAFCQYPNDLASSFDRLARFLGEAFVKNVINCRPVVLSALRRLLSQHRVPGPGREALALYSKNFLPLFFNAYLEEDKGPEKSAERQNILEVIKLYLEIAPQSMSEIFFDNCISKITQDTSSPYAKAALLDICRCLVIYQQSNKVSIFYDLINHLMESADATLQKKSYRCVEVIASPESSPICQEFTNQNVSKIVARLSEVSKNVKPSCMAPRLRCFMSLLEKLPADRFDLLHALLAEAVPCLRSASGAAKKATNVLLVRIGHIVDGWTADGLDKLIVHICGGFSSTGSSLTATIRALHRLLLSFPDKVSLATQRLILDSTCVLLSNKLQEVALACLTTVRIALRIFSFDLLSQYFANLAQALAQVRRHSSSVKVKLRVVFSRFIKKFGFAEVFKLAPLDLQKMMKNIKKVEERAKRKRESQDLDENESDEAEDVHLDPDSFDNLLRDSDASDLEPEEEKREARRGKKAWLKEDPGGEIIDFLDTSASKNVLATRPVSRRMDSHVKEFPVTKDGKLIIQDSEDESDKEEKAEVNDIKEMIDSLEIKKSKKRRGIDVELDKEEEAPAGYQAGGKGIHRPVNVAKRKKLKGSINRHTGAEFKSEKSSGDVKRGKVDPYAYLPLQLSSLNRRKRAKHTGQFKSLLKGARKGAIAGKKNKSKKRYR